MQKELQVIDILLTQIKDNILTNNPKTFVKGYAGARQYQDGKVVIYDNNEGTYVGLQDTKYNYFYIRYSGKIDVDAAENQSTSCKELTGKAPLKLIAWVNNADLNKLCDVLIQDIMQTEFTSGRFSDIKIYFEGMELDPETIFKEETQSDDVRLAKGVTLVSIDFGIQFNYKTMSDDCIDRDICVGCD